MTQQERLDFLLSKVEEHKVTKATKITRRAKWENWKKT
jgi:hypothetical protein